MLSVVYYNAEEFEETLQNASGRFRQYDYGNVDKNLQIYNSTTPPDYQLEKITAPIALFSSDDDWLATTKVYHVQLKKCSFYKKMNLL